MRTTIQLKLFGMLALLTGIFAALVLIANSFLSYHFYLQNKKKELNDVGLQVEKLISLNLGTENLDTGIELLRNEKPFVITIIDKNNQLIYPRSHHARHSMRGPMPRFSDMMEKPMSRPNKPIRFYPVDDYSSFLLYRAMPGSPESLEYRKIIPEGFLLIVKSPMVQITDTVNVFNKLLLFIALIALVLMSILARYGAKRFTRPLLQIEQAAKRLANMDFSEPIELPNNDEIGDLAANINWLSHQFEASLEVMAEQNKKLQEDIVSKEKMHRQQKQFIAAVSHELKSPLFIVEGYTELLQNELLPQQVKALDHAKTITDEVEHMNALITDLLKLSELEEKGQQVKEGRYNLSDSLKKVLDLYQPLALKKNLCLDNLVETPLWVTGQISEGELVLRNYLKNALEHASDYSSVIIRAEKKGDMLLTLSVFNQGDSISAEEAGQIWQPFYKIDASRNRQQGGTGLGLALVAAVQSRCGLHYGFTNHDNGITFWADFRLEP